jgi:hypothetical protein
MTIPEHTLHQLRAYVENGDSMGDFLTAVMSNNLMRACQSGDEANLAALVELMSYVYVETPMLCHGSIEIVREWQKLGGRVGWQKEQDAEAKRAAEVWDDGQDGFSHGVPYTWGLAGPDGAWFTLKPMKGVHNQADVRKAQGGLRRTTMKERHWRLF